MSFRRFVYFCAVCGAWSGFCGWLLGSLLAPAGGTAGNDALRAALLGGFLGLSVALGLSLLDSAPNMALVHWGRLARRGLLAVAVGSAGGVLGAFVGQLLYGWTQLTLFFLFGWTLVGLLVGASVGSFEFLGGLMRGDALRAVRKKLRHCLIGGCLGGFLGGLVALMLRTLAASIFIDKDQDRLLSPTALGFVALGACIGLLIGLAQVILKESWVRVEAGFRPGREIILAKERVSIGRGEGTDIPLFGDARVEKLHAYIIQRADSYVLEEAGRTQGTYVNDHKVEGTCPLRSGDLIRMGRSTLRFSERRKS